MSTIIPQSHNSGIGNVLVSIHTISEEFMYPKVVKRHVKTTLEWFFDRDAYTPQELLKGFKRELYVLENDKALACIGSYYNYIDAIKAAEDIMLDKYPIWDYPEFYI